MYLPPRWSDAEIDATPIPTQLATRKRSSAQLRP
jgi:hypothetical protein